MGLAGSSPDIAGARQAAARAARGDRLKRAQEMDDLMGTTAEQLDAKAKAEEAEGAETTDGAEA